LAEGDFQDRTEKATSKKRSDARKKGQVSQSREVSSVAVLLTGLSTICLFGSYMYNKTSLLMAESFSMIKNPVLGLSEFLVLGEHVVRVFITAVIPLMLAVALVAILSNVMQIGFMFNLTLLAPKFEKLNPLQGIKKFASKRALMELFKSVSKLGIIGLVAYWTAKGEMDRFFTLPWMDVSAIGLHILKVILKLFIRVCLIMILLAAIDFIFQKWQHEEKLKMTKQEVKEEFKQMEGDPQIKSRIRKVQIEIAKKRMMQEVPKADVVVTNPVHLAIAIKYDNSVMNAPQVVAKGAELLADKIRVLAREHSVPVVENKKLARELYKTVEIGGEIPSDFYQAVAEVLAYVYRLKGKAA